MNERKERQQMRIKKLTGVYTNKSKNEPIIN